VDTPTPGEVPLDEIRVDESYWGAGASEVVRRWLAEDYDPRVMPQLVVSRRADGFSYVLGWQARPEYNGGETLHEAIFGSG